MSKKILIIIVVIMAAIGAGMAYLLVTDDAKQAKDDMANSQQSSEPTSQPTGTPTQPGAYVDYSDSVIANTPGTKVLFFHAPWCPQCRALEADIKAKGVPAGVTIIKVDYDSNQALRQKYEVRLQTTLVKVDDNGALVQKYVAYDQPNIEAVKQNVL